MARGRWNGGIIGPNLKVSTSSASGIFSLSEAQVDVSAGLLPAVPPPYIAVDPQFNLTTLLLHGDGSTTNNNTFLDESTNAATITRNGTPTQGTFSPFSQTGWSYFCNYATPDYFTVASSGSPVAALGLGTGAFTIEFWVFPIVGINTWNALFDINQYTGGILMRYQGGSDSLYILGTAYDWSPVSNLKLGQWSHIALSRNGSGVFRMYVNGISVVTGTNAANLGSTGYMAINAAQHAGGQNFTAHYSNFRIVKGSTVYDPTVTTLTVPTSPLTAITNTVFLSCQNRNFVDNSASALTITPVGSPATQPFIPFAPGSAYGVSAVGGSAYFNGSTDYLSVPSNANLTLGTSDFTIEFWAYWTDTSSTYPAIYDQRPGANGAYPLILLLSGVLSYYVNTAQVIAGPTVVKNQWYHVAVARSSNVTKLFVNGVQAGSSYSDTTNYSGGAINIGRTFDGYYTTGYISNLRVVKGTAVYTSNFTPPTSPATAISGAQLLLNGTNSGVYDSTARNDVSTVGTCQISSSQSKYGGSSIYFATAGDGLTIPSTSYMSILGTGNFTIEFWMRSTQSASQVDLIRSTTWAIIAYSNSQLYWQSAYASGSNSYYPYGSLFDGNWHHVAIVRSATSTLTMYVDGVSIGSGTDTTNYTTNSAITIGISGSYGQFLGYMDDIRITKGYARYTSNFTPPTTTFPNQ
jgi:hypothetical protein